MENEGNGAAVYRKKPSRDWLENDALSLERMKERHWCTTAQALCCTQILCVGRERVSSFDGSDFKRR